MAALLDVNVLVALFDPEHIHHEAAHRWFETNRAQGWATCPLTENALVRVLSSPAYPGRRTTVDDATRRLEVFCRQSDHCFWQDSVSLRDPQRFRSRSFQGPRQVTDAYLLALAVDSQGSLATFDRRIPMAAVVGATERHLDVLEG
jgi:hypothetical protein